MIGSGLPKRNGIVGSRVALLASVVALVVGLAGCGHDGSAGVTLPGPPSSDKAQITGIVSAPHGELAMNKRAWWPEQLRVVSPAYALQGVFPVGQGLPVSLSMVDALDAGDGVIDKPKPLVLQAPTDIDGRYKIIDDAADDVFVCRKLVEVGSGDARTRAFVTSHTVDIDAESEAVVRVILNRIGTSTAQLCDFTNKEIDTIRDEVHLATYTTAGDSVAEVNQIAFEKAMADPDVQRALEDAAP